MTNLHDITERRSLEQQLQYSEQKLRSLVESNILGVIVVDFDGRIYEINDRFAQILGYSRDELLAETFNWSPLIPPDAHEAAGQVMTTILSTGALASLGVGIPAQGRQLRLSLSRDDSGGIFVNPDMKLAALHQVSWWANNLKRLVHQDICGIFARIMLGSILRLMTPAR